MPQPKLHDVASLAGVSPTTVSRVLNNRGYLSQATRTKVQRAMDDLGYRPNAIARSLQGQKSLVVGIIFPSVAHPFYGQMAAEIETRLADAGYKVLLCNSDDHPERERKHLDMLLANQVDGIITGAHSDVVANFPRLRAPLVTIDRPNPGDFPNIRCDNRGISARVVAGLVERGARTIAHLTSSQTPGNPRQQGYLDAVGAAGLEPLVLRTERGERWTEDFEAVAAHLAAHPEIDAVVASNDVLAASVARWTRERGVNVPRDLQVVGFDGSSAVRTMWPALTTVVQPYGAIADRAVEHLLAAIQDRPVAEGSDEIPASIAWNGTTR